MPRANRGGLKAVFNGATTGLGGILSLPALGPKMVLTVVIIGGVALVLLVGGLSWGVGSGKVDVGDVMKQGAEIGKLAAMKGAI